MCVCAYVCVMTCIMLARNSQLGLLDNWEFNDARPS